MWGPKKQQGDKMYSSTPKVERLLSLNQQAAYMTRRMSARGAGIDTLGRVREELDPLADYKSNLSDLHRKYGLIVGGEQIGSRRVKEQQCHSEISLCRAQSIKSSCEFACHECKDKESCDELEEIKSGVSWEEQALKMPSIKPKEPPNPKPMPVKVEPIKIIKKKPCPHIIRQERVKVLTQNQINKIKRYGFVDVSLNGRMVEVTKRNMVGVSNIVKITKKMMGNNINGRKKRTKNRR